MTTAEQAIFETDLITSLAYGDPETIENLEAIMQLEEEIDQIHIRICGQLPVTDTENTQEISDALEDAKDFAKVISDNCSTVRTQEVIPPNLKDHTTASITLRTIITTQGIIKDLVEKTQEIRIGDDGIVISTNLRAKGRIPFLPREQSLETRHLHPHDEVSSFDTKGTRHSNHPPFKAEEDKLISSTPADLIREFREQMEDSLKTNKNTLDYLVLQANNAAASLGESAA